MMEGTVKRSLWGSLTGLWRGQKPAHRPEGKQEYERETEGLGPVSKVGKGQESSEPGHAPLKVSVHVEGQESPDSGYETVSEVSKQGSSNFSPEESTDFELSSLDGSCDEPRNNDYSDFPARGLCPKPEGLETNLFGKPESACDHQRDASAEFSSQQSDGSSDLGLESVNVRRAWVSAGCGVSNDQLQGDGAFIAGDFAKETAKLVIRDVLEECPGNGLDMLKAVLLEMIQMYEEARSQERAEPYCSDSCEDSDAPELMSDVQFSQRLASTGLVAPFEIGERGRSGEGGRLSRAQPKLHGRGPDGWINRDAPQQRGEGLKNVPKCGLSRAVVDSTNLPSWHLSGAMRKPRDKYRDPAIQRRRSVSRVALTSSSELRLVAPPGDRESSCTDEDDLPGGGTDSWEEMSSRRRDHALVSEGSMTPGSYDKHHRTVHSFDEVEDVSMEHEMGMGFSDQRHDKQHDVAGVKGRNWGNVKNDCDRDESKLAVRVTSPNNTETPLTATKLLQALSKPKEEPISIPEYDGTEDLDGYLAQVSMIFSFEDVDQLDCARLLSRALRGDALEVLTFMPPLGPRSYEYLLQDLNLRFGTGDQRRKSIVALFNIKQDTEDVRCFGQAIRRMTLKAYPGESKDKLQPMMVQIFMQGLRDVVVLQHVLRQLPGTLKEAIDIAMLEETLETLEPTTQNDISKPDSEDLLKEVRNLVSDIRNQRFFLTVVCWACKGKHKINDCPNISKEDREVIITQKRAKRKEKVASGNSDGVFKAGSPALNW